MELVALWEDELTKLRQQRDHYCSLILSLGTELAAARDKVGRSHP